MRFWSRLTQPALYAAGLSILFVMLVAACGGGGDEGPAPAATAAPAATSPPATATPAPAAETPAAPAETPAASGGGESSSGSEKLFIVASSTAEIPVNLAAGDVLEVKFDVESNITGGQNVSAGIGQAAEGIQVVIHDPMANALITIEDTTDSDSVTVTAETSGEHQIIFFNPFPLQAITVDASWTVNP